MNLIDTSKIKKSTKSDDLEGRSNPDFLYCREELLPSDKEDDNSKNYNLYDSDDSVKDKDYIPDTGESSLSDEEKTTPLGIKRKLKGSTESEKDLSKKNKIYAEGKKYGNLIKQNKTLNEKTLHEKRERSKNKLVHDIETMKEHTGRDYERSNRGKLVHEAERQVNMNTISDRSINKEKSKEKNGSDKKIHIEEASSRAERKYEKEKLMQVVDISLKPTNNIQIYSQVKSRENSTRTLSYLSEEKNVRVTGEESIKDSHVNQINTIDLSTQIDQTEKETNDASQLQDLSSLCKMLIQKNYKIKEQIGQKEVEMLTEEISCDRLEEIVENDAERTQNLTAVIQTDKTEIYKEKKSGDIPINEYKSNEETTRHKKIHEIKSSIKKIVCYSPIHTEESIQGQTLREDEKLMQVEDISVKENSKIVKQAQIEIKDNSSRHMSCLSEEQERVTEEERTEESLPNQINNIDLSAQIQQTEKETYDASQIQNPSSPSIILTHESSVITLETGVKEVEITTEEISCNLSDEIAEHNAETTEHPDEVTRTNEADPSVIDQELSLNVVVGKGFTKSGKPRQRRKFEESKDARKVRNLEEKKEKLYLKNPCDDSCKKKCITKINTHERKVIHDKYIAMVYEEQGLFIKCMVDEIPVKRRLVKSLEKRQTTKVYHLKVNNSKIEVCKKFFLTTLGYNAKNDGRVRLAMKKSIESQKCNRGKYERMNKIDRDLIKQHIQTFNPCISHYRREHAPNRLYLPSDISVTSMYKLFCSQWPDLKVSLESYRLVVKEMKISFVRLGHEECEQCAEFVNHNPNHDKDNLDEICEGCNSYLAHKQKYRQTRIEYKKDAELAKEEPNEVIFSVDLQKVVMLPRIDQFKTAIFCSRIIAFNETFAPLSCAHDVPFAALWNESISGRKQEDIVSTFHAFLMSKRDAKNITLWLDNCSAQNKNWALISFFVQIVNSNSIAAESITLKYLEPGHTFMSADSFHHQVEQSMKRMGKVYDFPDFVECVRSANSRRNFVKVMEVSDFSDYQDISSRHKLKKMTPRVYLKDIVAIKVERNLYELKYKKNHDDEEFETLDFLQMKVVKTKEFPTVSVKTNSRGINIERKLAIVEKLLPLMPENRRHYWKNLPVSDAADLTQED